VLLPPRDLHRMVHRLGSICLQRNRLERGGGERGDGEGGGDGAALIARMW